MTHRLAITNPSKVIGYLCIPVAALSVFLLCWHRSYQDADLVGSWRFTTGRVMQTYTFSPDHRLTIAVWPSSKDLRCFADWAIDHGQLVITVRSNSFAPAVTNRETARIGKLTESVLILKDRDKLSDEPRERRFQRLK